MKQILKNYIKKILSFKFNFVPLNFNKHQTLFYILFCLAARIVFKIEQESIVWVVHNGLFLNRNCQNLKCPLTIHLSLSIANIIQIWFFFSILMNGSSIFERFLIISENSPMGTRGTFEKSLFGISKAAWGQRYLLNCP